MVCGKMESPYRAFSCHIHIERVAAPTFKEAAIKWAGELLVGYSNHITSVYKINVALAIARLHLYCIHSPYIYY